VNVPAYDSVPDSTFSSNTASSEYLTISRPENGNLGTITISNVAPLQDFVGSYYLELRAHHQGVTTIKRVSHTGYDCDITVGYDTSNSIIYYLGTGALDTDLQVSVENSELCPAPDAYSLLCNDQTFCLG